MSGVRGNFLSQEGTFGNVHTACDWHPDHMLSFIGSNIRDGLRALLPTLAKRVKEKIYQSNSIIGYIEKRFSWMISMRKIINCLPIDINEAQRRRNKTVTGIKLCGSVRFCYCISTYILL